MSMFYNNTCWQDYEITKPKNYSYNKFSINTQNGFYDEKYGVESSKPCCLSNFDLLNAYCAQNKW